MQSPTTHTNDVPIGRRTLSMVDMRVLNTHTSSFCLGAFGAKRHRREAKHMKTLIVVTSWPRLLGVTRIAC
jgi:hypothetical protein